MSASAAVKQIIQRTGHLKQVARLIWQSGPRWTAISLLLFLIQGLLPLVSLYLLKLVVDVAASADAAAAADAQAVFGKVALLIALTGAVTLISTFIQSGTQLVRQVQNLKISDHVYEILHAKAVEVDLECYENAKYYDRFHRAQREAPFRAFQIMQNFFEISGNGISLLAMAGLLLSFHWAMVPVLLLAAVPGLLVRLQYAHTFHRWQHGRTAAERRSWYFSHVLTEHAHAKEVRLFELGSLFKGWFGKERAKLRRERTKIAAKSAFAELVTEVCGTLAIFGSFAFFAYQTVLGAVTLGYLVMYYMAFQRAQGFLRAMLRGLAGLYENTLFVADLYELLAINPKVAEPPHPRPVPRPLRQGIRLENLSFKYPEGTRPVLNRVSLTVRPGEHIALVGENGSGKITLVKLLCRLYDPDKGAITLDGTDLRKFRLTELRRQISVVLQDFAQYQLTARQNIWLGSIDQPPDEQQIITAARLSGADAFIRSLPQGYDTLLGRQFEEGEELSLGQWQKIALARAFFRDAQILILDEPTSALDAKAEFDLFARYRELARGRTAILISHRLSTVRTADTIYVLEKGRIAEQGHHDELMRQGGIYAQLFEKQARQYR